MCIRDSAWAVAESAIDTVAIMSGEKVLLFKQGKDWTLSAQGAIKNAIGAVYDVTADAVEETCLLYTSRCV